MGEAPKHEPLLVALMYANSRTGRRENAMAVSMDGIILGAYGQDTLNGIGKLLMKSFANNFDLVLVDTFFSSTKSGISHSSNE